jgi:CheY-like chemotaxis protein
MEKSKKIVMIVEDDAFVRDIYETKLKEEGITTISAEDGGKALKKLEEEVAPDLILLDILMPYMDGLALLKAIKKNPTLKNIPVILLTNLSQKEEIQEGFDLGAKDYIVKSHFTPSEVMEKVKKYL